MFGGGGLAGCDHHYRLVITQGICNGKEIMGKDEPKPTKIQEKQKHFAQLVADLFPLPTDIRQAVLELWQDRVNARIGAGLQEIKNKIQRGFPDLKDQEEYEKVFIKEINIGIEELTQEKQRRQSRIVVAPKGAVIHDNSGGPH